MTRLIHGLAAALAFGIGAGAQAATIMLGTYAFDSDKFGNSLSDTDVGVHQASNWLNVDNADPGFLQSLTLDNFDTGIANIGLSGPVTYTIGYTGGIVNGAGADLGVVVARYSTDNFDIAFDGGASANVGSGSAVDSGETRVYFYNGTGPFTAQLWVHLIDLSDYGIAVGDSIDTLSITGSSELDLIRAAGLAPVPEPDTVAMLLAGLGAVGAIARRRRARG